MGTRNLTLVKSKNKTKVAQYSQWDGYPEGQGTTILNFLHRNENDLKSFKSKVDKLTEVSEDELSDLWRSCGANDSGFVSFDVSKRFKTLYPQFHRDVGGEILDLINEEKTLMVSLDEDFIDDGLFCEWAYEINFDDNTFNVYKNGRNKVAEFDLNKLPTLDEFYAKLS